MAIASADWRYQAAPRPRAAVQSRSHPIRARAVRRAARDSTICRLGGDCVMSELDRVTVELQAMRLELARAKGMEPPPVLHGPPTMAALSAALSAMTLPPPPSYREFLERHNGWERFWNRFSIVGVEGPQVERAREDITVSI